MPLASYAVSCSNKETLIVLVCTVDAGPVLGPVLCYRAAVAIFRVIMQ